MFHYNCRNVKLSTRFIKRIYLNCERSLWVRWSARRHQMKGFDCSLFTGNYLSCCISVSLSLRIKLLLHKIDYRVFHTLHCCCVIVLTFSYFSYSAVTGAVTAGIICSTHRLERWFTMWQLSRWSITDSSIHSDSTLATMMTFWVWLSIPWKTMWPLDR